MRVFVILALHKPENVRYYSLHTPDAPKIPKPTFSTKLRTVACRKGNKAASSGTVTLTGTGAVEGTALSKPQRRDENLSEQ